MPPKPRDVSERFWSKVDKSGECWEWTSSVGTTGYGQFYFSPDQRVVRAHRASMMLLHGDLDQSVFVLHRCDNRLCVRPDHLYLGDHSQNMADMHSRGRERPWGREATHCKNGHPFDAENTRIAKNRNGTQRACRACARKYQRDARARKKSSMT
jgi:hypothetical protein